MGLNEIVVGADPADVEGPWERMYDLTSYYGRRGVVIHAISAVDIALWDLRGNVQGRSVGELLGERRRDRCACIRPLSGHRQEVMRDCLVTAGDFGP